MATAKKEPKWQNTNIGRERRELLQSRIRQIEQLNWRDEEDRKEPAAVVKARKVVDDYAQARQKVLTESRKERSALCDKVKATILFTEDFAILGRLNQRADEVRVVDCRPMAETLREYFKTSGIFNAPPRP